MKKFYRFFLSILPFLFFASIVCVLFYKILFQGEIFYEAFDNFHYVIPLKQFLVDQIKNGTFPLWNPYLFTGIPYFADITIGTLSPFNAIFLFFPVANGVAFASALSIFLLLVFQYILLRYVGASRIAAIFGALLFALSGTVFLNIGAMDVITVIVYMPLLFYLAQKFTKSRMAIYFFLILIVQALQIVSGHPRITYYTILWLCMYLFIYLQERWRKRFVFIGIYGLSALLLASVQLFPFGEYILFSSRPLGGIAYASSGALHFSQVITAFFPTFFGTHAQNTWWGAQTMLYGYMTAPGLIALWFGVVKGKFDKKLFYICGLIVSLLLAVGKYSPMYLLFYFFVPGWKAFRSPSDMMIFFSFFASIIASFGLEYIVHKRNNFLGKGKNVLFFFSVLFVMVGAFYLLVNNSYFFWQHELQFLNKYVSFFHISRLLIYDQTKLQVMFQGVLENFLILLLSLIFSIVSIVKIRSRKIIAATLVIIGAILFMFYDKYVVITAPSVFLHASTNASVFSNIKNDEYRILSLPVDLHQRREHLAIPSFFYQEAQAKLLIYAGDTNMLSYIYQVNATSPLVPSSYADFINSKKSSLTQIDFINASVNKLSQSSVKYILSYGSSPTLEHRFTLSSVENNQYVYLNEKADKRFYLQKGGTVRTIKNGIQQIVLQVDSNKNNSLIITDLYYPGWEAVVNGKTVVIKKYLGTFQQVSVPKGKSEIILTYKPLSLYVGSWISVASLFLFICAALFFRNKRL